MRPRVIFLPVLLFLLNLGLAACDDDGGGSLTMTAEEQEAFDYTNYARTDPQGFAEEFLREAHDNGTDNGAYADLMARQPVGALELSPGLFAAARAHSRDLNENCQRLQHDSCDGTIWSDRISSYYNGGNLAENAAWGYPTGLDVVLGWIIDHNIDGVGHRVALLNGDYTHVGIGLAGTYWTQDFGAGGTN